MEMQTLSNKAFTYTVHKLYTIFSLFK